MTRNRPSDSGSTGCVWLPAAAAMTLGLSCFIGNFTSKPANLADSSQAPLDDPHNYNTHFVTEYFNGKVAKVLRSRAAEICEAPSSWDPENIVDMAQALHCVTQVDEMASYSGPVQTLLYEAVKDVGFCGFPAGEFMHDLEAHYNAVDLFDEKTPFNVASETQCVEEPHPFAGLNDDGTWRGSGGSPDGCHLYEALKACSEHLLGFGGHGGGAPSL